MLYEECGIYCIKNLLNGKLYIGSSKDTHDRRIHHFSDLRNNRHGNSRLQNSFNKYGEGYFKFEIIEYVDCDSLLNKEQYWIDFYKSYDRRLGFNLQPIAGRTTPWINKKHHSEEARRKIGKSNKGKIRTEKMRKNCSDAQKKLYASGYIHPNKGKKKRSGEQSLSWKGGKAKCAICGIILSTYKVKTCKKHISEYRKLMENENIDIPLGKKIERKKYSPSKILSLLA